VILSVKSVGVAGLRTSKLSHDINKP
jgi:hypothetical protein